MMKNGPMIISASVIKDIERLCQSQMFTLFNSTKLNLTKYILGLTCKLKIGDIPAVIDQKLIKVKALVSMIILDETAK